MAAVLEVLDPEIEWIEPEGSPWASIYRGHDEVLGLFQTVAGLLGPDWRVEPERFLATHDGAVVLGRHRGRNGDGAWSIPFAMVWEMRGGKAVRFAQYADTALTRDIVAATRPA